jgi:hypothetical protein
LTRNDFRDLVNDLTLCILRDAEKHTDVTWDRVPRTIGYEHY